MDDLVAGPFRTAEPTPEARQAREREASWERVRVATEAALRGERRRERLLDRLAGAAVIATAVVTAGVLVLAAYETTAGAPLVCPSIAAAISAVFVLVRRSRRGR